MAGLRILDTSGSLADKAVYSESEIVEYGVIGRVVMEFQVQTALDVPGLETRVVFSEMGFRKMG
jgi:hypothetical protein